jgi:hypothetical protein
MATFSLTDADLVDGELLDANLLTTFTPFCRRFVYIAAARNPAEFLTATPSESGGTQLFSHSRLSGRIAAIFVA